VEIARRSRGTPRIVNRLLRRVRDFAQVAGSDGITAEAVVSAMKRLEVDEKGFDEMDRRLMLAIIEKFEGGRWGSRPLRGLGEEKDTLEDVYEPYLIQEGFLDRTPGAGRPPSLPTSISEKREQRPARNGCCNRPNL